MYVTIRLAANAEGSKAFDEVLKSATDLGLRLQRMPSRREAHRPFYAAPTYDMATAQAFLAAVKQSPALEAAYLKPADSIA